jgi:protein tyrosine phosphatase
MTFRRVDLPPETPGRLWLASMPGRFESWSDFLAEARTARLSLVLCLTPMEEVASGAPGYHRAITQGQLPFAWLNLPMRNYGLPLSQGGFRAGIERVGAALIAGDSVLLHCAAGMGRTGTAAACVLKHLGLPADEALQRIRDAGSNPENALQSGLVNWF